MNSEQLNMRVADYKRSGGHGDFIKVFDHFTPTWTKNARRDASWTLSDVSTVTALYHDSLIDAIAKWQIDSGDFEKYLTRWVNQRRRNLRRKNQRRIRDIPLEPLENSDGTQKEIDSEYILDDDVLQKKEADKRQLVDSLLESTTILKDHSTMTAIIEEYRKDDSRDKSDLAIAKSLGMHHETVKRKLNSLARRYDANRFGDISDYLAV